MSAASFEFLRAEWPAVFEAAGKAEAAVHTDPRTACFYARRALELSDIVAMPILLVGFTPYLTDQFDAEVVYRGS